MDWTLQYYLCTSVVRHGMDVKNESVPVSCDVE